MGLGIIGVARERPVTAGIWNGDVDVVEEWCRLRRVPA